MNMVIPRTLYNSLQAIANSNEVSLMAIASDYERVNQYISILKDEYSTFDSKDACSEPSSMVNNEESYAVYHIVIPKIERMNSTGKECDDVFINAVYNRIHNQMRADI